MKNVRHYRRNGYDILTWNTEMGERTVYALKVYKGNDPIFGNCFDSPRQRSRYIVTLTQNEAKL